MANSNVSFGLKPINAMGGMRQLLSKAHPFKLNFLVAQSKFWATLLATQSKSWACLPAVNMLTTLQKN